MIKISNFIIILAIICFYGCGPSAAELAAEEQKVQDSIAQAQTDSIDAVLNMPDEVGVFKNSNFTNAYMIDEYTGATGGRRFYLIPSNIDEYEYLSYNPTVALSFVLFNNEDYIKSLTIYDLQRIGVSAREYDPILPFSEIKGCEELAKSIPTYDEFTLLEKKDEIIQTILNSYINIHNEYVNKYLKGFDAEGTYKFAHITDGNRYREINKNSYNFEKQEISIRIPFIKTSGDQNVWEYMYTYAKFPNQYEKGDKIKVRLSLEDAKKLFNDDIQVFEETIYTVKPKYGYHGRDSYRYGFFTDFDILYYTINYYNGDKWDNQKKIFVESPILSIKIVSNKHHQLH